MKTDESVVQRTDSRLNKNRIMAAASALLLRRGTSGLSVRAIAAEANLSTIGIYSHFNGKQGILDALYVEGFGYVQQATDIALQEIYDPKEAALYGAKNYLEVADKHEASYRLIFGEADANYEPGLEARMAGRKAFHSLVNLVAPVLSDKATKKQKQEAAIQIWALLHGFVSIRHHGAQDIVKIEDWTPQILRAVSDMIDSLIGK